MEQNNLQSFPTKKSNPGNSIRTLEHEGDSLSIKKIIASNSILPRPDFRLVFVHPILSPFPSFSLYQSNFRSQNVTTIYTCTLVLNIIQ